MPRWERLGGTVTKLEPRAQLALRLGPWAVGLAAWAVVTHRAWPDSQVLLGADANQIVLPLKQFLVDEVSAHRLPTWYPYDGVGVSFPGSLLGGLLDPLNALLLALSPAQALKWMTLLSLAIAAGGALVLARALGLPRRAAAFSGLAFALSGVALSQTSTLCYLESLSRIPWALAAALHVRRRASPGAAAALGIALASILWAGDPESFAVAGLVVGGLLGGGKARLRARLLAALLALALTVALTFPVLLPALHQMAGSARASALSESEALSWSLHPARLLELALGSAFSLGGDRGPLPADFGGQNDGFWSSSIFCGSLVVLFAIAGLGAGWRAKRWRTVAGLGALGAWLALGRFGHGYAHVPGLMHFRYPEKLEVWAVLAIALLAGRGLLRLTDPHRALRASLGFLLALGIGAQLIRSATGLSYAPGLGKAALALAAFAGVVRLRPRWARLLAVAALALLEPALGNAPWLEVGPESMVHEAENPLPEVGPDDRLCVDLASSGDALPAERRDRAGRSEAARLTLDHGLSALFRVRSTTQQIPLASSGLTTLCGVTDICQDPCARMLGARWVIESSLVAARLVESGQYRRARDLPFPEASLLEDHLTAPYAAVLPAVTYADEWKTVQALHQHRLQPGAQALIAAGVLPANVIYPGRGSASARRDQPDRVEVETAADTPGILVVREGYSPDWRVTVDNVPKHVIEADLGFIGVVVAGGRHQVELIHVPWGWPGAFVVYAMALLGCAVLLLNSPRRKRSHRSTSSS